MSTTPGSKLSPFGNSIRKTLLTPCRRVGLSRKTKTPNSINKLLSQTPVSNTKLSDQQSNITPVNKNKTPIKRKSLVELANPMEKSCKLEDNVKSKPNAKKSLNECFNSKESELKSNTIPTEPTDEKNIKQVVTSKKNSKKCKKNSEHENIDNESKKNSNVKDIKKIEQIGVDCKKVIPKEYDINTKNEQNTSDSEALEIKTVAQVHVGSIQNDQNFYGLVSDHDYHKKDITNEDTKNPVCKEIFKENISNKKMVQCFELETNNSSTSTSSSPIVRKPCKNRILSDSDDDFTILPPENAKNKNESNNKNILVERSTSINNECVERIRDCKIGLQNLSEEDMNIIKNKTKKKNKKFILSDDSDDDFCPKSSMKIKKSMSEMKLKTKTSSNSSTGKTDSGPGDKKSTENHSKSKNFSKTVISQLSFDDEDEDAFTSTPDREKNEKRELIEKIKDLESKIKIKKQKVDNLNRASVYKSKHNVNELKQLSDTWRQGCVLGLNELIVKLQNHGPIDMTTLLRNLRIPDEMVARIFVDVISD
ncbi:unnamed protein product [Psylliodes chrysocephalus]|uniref:Swi5-dependent recombination DNA repair protein 1 homolog n=1 Tax=Psylliodes chrysocephalus TaxID=3402493 RepID=A0A9P0GGL6_9CUCU|nr:unnamed protein product [Psylliodes chrysocephala]